MEVKSDAESEEQISVHTLVRCTLRIPIVIAKQWHALIDIGGDLFMRLIAQPMKDMAWRLERIKLHNVILNWLLTPGNDTRKFVIWAKYSLQPSSPVSCLQLLHEHP